MASDGRADGNVKASIRREYFGRDIRRAVGPRADGQHAGGKAGAAGRGDAEVGREERWQQRPRIERGDINLAGQIVECFGNLAEHGGAGVARFFGEGGIFLSPFLARRGGGGRGGRNKKTQSE